MQIPSVVRLALCAQLALGVSLASAAQQEQAVMVFKLPAASPASHARGDTPACGQSLAIPKLLGNDKLHAALVSADAKTVHVYASTKAVLDKVAVQAAEAGVLTVGNGPSRCESGCIVLPEGARITRMFLSDRNQGPGMSIESPRESNELESNTDVSMGDYGYQDLHTRRDDRAVCVTAKNSSTAGPTTQVVRVEFVRR